MTDRVHALTVVLEQPVRDDDVQPLIDAIRMMRGVADVKMHIHDANAMYAESKAREEVLQKLYALMQELRG